MSPIPPTRIDDALLEFVSEFEEPGQKEPGHTQGILVVVPAGFPTIPVRGHWRSRVKRTRLRSWRIRAKFARRRSRKRLTTISTYARLIALNSGRETISTVREVINGLRISIPRPGVHLRITKASSRRFAFAAAAAVMIGWQFSVQGPSDVATADLKIVATPITTPRALLLPGNRLPDKTEAAKFVSADKTGAAKAASVGKREPAKVAVAPAAAPTRQAQRTPVPRRPEPTPAVFYGALAVQSEPDGARVFINGQPVGTTPVMVKRLPIGSRVVRVEAEGYRTWSGSVRVVADRQTHVNPTLDALIPR